jgi:hypothetical protein
MLSSSVMDVQCYEGGTFFRTSQTGCHPTECTAVMYRGQGVFKYSPSKYEELITVLLSVAVQKTRVLNIFAMPTWSLPLAACLQNHFLIFVLILVTMDCAGLPTSSYSASFCHSGTSCILPITCYSCHIKACLLLYWLTQQFYLVDK